MNANDRIDIDEVTEAGAMAIVDFESEGERGLVGQAGTLSTSGVGWDLEQPLDEHFRFWLRLDCGLVDCGRPETVTAGEFAIEDISFSRTDGDWHAQDWGEIAASVRITEVLEGTVSGELAGPVVLHEWVWTGDPEYGEAVQGQRVEFLSLAFRSLPLEDDGF